MARAAKKTKSVSKANLVDSVTDRTKLSKKDVKSVVDTFINEVSEHLSSGGKVQLTGFGTFEVRERQARTGVRPGTTNRIDIPASKYPAFKAGKALKERMK